MRKMRDSRTSWKVVYINLFLVLQAGHIKAVIPVIQDLEDKICEEDERLQDFVDGQYNFWLLCFVRDNTETERASLSLPEKTSIGIVTVF